MAVSIQSVKTKQLAQKSKKILQLLKEIKELTDAYGIGNKGTDITEFYIMQTVEQLAKLDTVKTVAEWKLGGNYACEVSSVIEGVKYACIATVEQMKQYFPLDWKEYCSVNNLCLECGAEIVDDGEYIGCKNQCDGIYKGA